jgi:hypothetical protein
VSVQEHLTTLTNDAGLKMTFCHATTREFLVKLYESQYVRTAEILASAGAASAQVLMLW